MSARALSADAGAGTPPAEPEPQSMADSAEMLWLVLANVSGGDWTKQSQDWQDAAARWRDNYFKSLTAERAGASDPQPQNGTPPAEQDEARSERLYGRCICGHLGDWHMARIPHTCTVAGCDCMELRAGASVPAVPPCANGHTWTNQFGDDWTPERGALCDCRKKGWGERVREIRHHAPEFDNHHNALACPYCNPDRLQFAKPEAAALAGVPSPQPDVQTPEGLREAVRHVFEGVVPPPTKEKL